MEKLGVEKQQLLSELKQQYSGLRNRLHGLEKTAASAGDRAGVEQEIAQIKARIDEIEASN